MFDLEIERVGVAECDDFLCGRVVLSKIFTTRRRSRLWSKVPGATAACYTEAHASITSQVRSPITPFSNSLY